MESRRKFIGQVATGLTGLATAGLGASDRIRVAIAGAGDRGMELFNQARVCSNIEIAGFADVVETRRRRAQAATPSAIVHSDWRKLLDDSSIDAVVIATPQHLHADQ